MRPQSFRPRFRYGAKGWKPIRRTFDPGALDLSLSDAIGNRNSGHILDSILERCARAGCWEVHSHWIVPWKETASIRYTWVMPSSGPLSESTPGPDGPPEPVWLTAGEAADAAHATHAQVAGWVASQELSARKGWRGGAEIQLVLLSDLESLVPRVDLDRVRGSLVERGVFTGPRRVVLGGFSASEKGASEDSAPSPAAVVRPAYQVREEDRVWASELDGEVRRLREVIRTIRADHESLEEHLDGQRQAPPHAVPAAGSDEAGSDEAGPDEAGPAPAVTDQPARSPESSSWFTSGALLAVACGVVLGMIGAAIFLPGEKTMAAESRGLPLADAAIEEDAPATRKEPAATDAEAAMAVLALDTMEGKTAPASGRPVESAATSASIDSGLIPAAVRTAKFNGQVTVSPGTPHATGNFFEHGFSDRKAPVFTDVTASTEFAGAAPTNLDPSVASIQVMGPELPPDLRPQDLQRQDLQRQDPQRQDPQRLAPPAGAAFSAPVPVEASAPIARSEATMVEQPEMLVELPPLKPRARSVKPNSLGAPKRLRVPMTLAELDRSLFARRSALLSDCAYTQYVLADPSAKGPSGALVLGPCFGPTREGQEGIVATPGTHRVGNVACCRHHAFVERMTAAALDEAARVGLRTEAKAALREGVLPPLFRLRASRAATRFLREETRGWTSAGLDGVAGTASTKDSVHDWKLSENQPGDGTVRVELTSWIQPVVPFNARPDASNSAGSGLKAFHMTILVQAAPDGDVLESFEWFVD